MNIAIIFAGGMGHRMNGSNNGCPKQFMEFDGKPLIIHTLCLFQNHKEIDKIYISIIPSYKKKLEELISKYGLTKVSGIVNGGSCAQESIYKALMLAESENDKNSIVLIHDGIRPIITEEVISKNIQSVKDFGTAITSTPCYETILISEDGKVPKFVPYRKNIYSAQAPQSFRLGDIIKAHKKIRNREEGYKDMVDNCTICETLGIKTHMIEGNFGNIKITTIEDVCILKALLNFNKSRMNLKK